MQLTFELTANDLKKYQFYHARTSPDVRRLTKFLWISILIMILLNAIMVTWPNPRHIFLELIVPSVIFGLFIVGLLLYCFLRFLGNCMQSRAIAQAEEQGKLGSHTVSYDENGITETNQVSTIQVKWKGVHRIDKTEEYIFIYISSSTAIVIPIRAFSMPKEAEDFYAYAISCKG